MSVADFALDPPFNVTRASHVVLNVRDPLVSAEFYRDLLGLVISDSSAEAAYLRGREESGHHSLVLQRGATADCARIGMRMRTDDDLINAHAYFDARGIASEFVERPYQGLTLHVQDSTGVPLEFVAMMDTRPRMFKDYKHYHSASAQRFDHYQLQSHDVRASHRFYQPLGFRCSEYTYAINGRGEEELWGVWLQRKGNPHDIVFTNGPGPRLHHFAYTVQDTHDLIHACDVAGSMGLGHRLERGPGRHGISGALFIYFRDPDGHRVEIFNTHYQAIDLEPPMAWDLADPRRADQWGLPAQNKWFAEATSFAGTPVNTPLLKADPPTLERFLHLEAV